MATENKDDLLDLIFSAPINLPEVKGPPAKPEVPEIHVVEHKDSDAHDKEDAHSNDGSIAHSDTSEKRRDSDAHKHEEHEKEDEHDHIHVKISEPEYTEIVKERRGTEDEQHYVMEESYVSDNESRDEKVHYQEVEEHHDDASDRGRADSDAKEEEEHMQQRAMPAAAPMQMHAVIDDDDDHKEHYIEEDVPIHHTESVSSKRSKSSSSSSSSSSDDEHEKHDEPIETAENYFAYDQEQTAVGTTPNMSREDRIDLEELEVFTHNFKKQRIKFGFTQGDVGLALGRRYGTEFSQTTISRFEGLNLSFNNMCKLRPLLKEWLSYAESAIASGATINDLLDVGKTEQTVFQPNYALPLLLAPPIEEPSQSIGSSGIAVRKRRKRTNLDTAQRAALDAFFLTNPKPDRDSVTHIAAVLELDRDVVRVWFCNRRQKQKIMIS